MSWVGGELTYRELDAAADRMAAALVARGVGAETPVAILLSRGPDYVIAMLAVLKAGGMIVPLDPAMPAERIADILAQTAATVVIDEGFLSGTHRRCDDSGPAVTVLPDQAAYVVFTSGTTGEPKGVIGTHRALLAYADDHAEHVLRPAAARTGPAAAHRARLVVHLRRGLAAAGGAARRTPVHIIGDDAQRDAEALVGIIDRYGLDMIDTTPSMFAQLRDVGLLSSVPLAVLALGGEAVTPPVWRLIREQCDRTGMAAYNCYGPTETTVEAVVAAIDRTRRAVDRASDREHPWLRAGLVAAAGARRCGRRAVPVRRAADPRLSRSRRRDRRAVRRRPRRRRRSHVPHR